MLTQTIFLFLLSYVSNELVAVVEINRHGARTPNNFPDLTAKNYFGSHDSSLTIYGYRQQQLLGKWVRSKYITNNHLLNPNYDQSEFEMISSPTQRTLFSSAAFLSGLFPEYTVKMNNGNQPKTKNDDMPPLDGNTIEFKEIPVEVLDYAGDSFFHATKCNYKGKKLLTWLKEEENKNIFELKVDEVESTLKELRIILGIPDSYIINKSKDDLKEVVKYFLPYIYNFKTNTNKFSELSWKTVKKFVINKWYAIRQSDTKYLRIAASKFLDDIRDVFNNAIDGTSNLKYRVFSGHDTIIVNILSNLLKPEYILDIANKALTDDSAFNQIVPPFACNLFFELHRVNGVYRVKVIYNGKTLTEGFKYLDKNDFQDGMIDYSEFKVLFENIIEEDYKLLECNYNARIERNKNRYLKKTKNFLKN